MRKMPEINMRYAVEMCGAGHINVLAMIYNIDADKINEIALEIVSEVVIYNRI